MKFLITDPTYLGGVYVEASGQKPTVVTLPDDSKNFSVHPHWQPLDKKAQAAQVEHARKAGIVKEKRKDGESLDDHVKRNQHRMFAEDWAGYAIAGEIPEGASRVDPRKVEAPLPPNAEKNPLGA